MLIGPTCAKAPVSTGGKGSNRSNVWISDSLGFHEASVLMMKGNDSSSLTQEERFMKIGRCRGFFLQPHHILQLSALRRELFHMLVFSHSEDLGWMNEMSKNDSFCMCLLNWCGGR